ncbi:putative membrane protein [Desulfosporosinus sp. OT]|nr:putative membrane protein [Desulfosporosinus sp. OT]
MRCKRRAYLLSFFVAYMVVDFLEVSGYISPRSLIDHSYAIISK